jgi:signal transduction histidine kinase
MVDPRISKYREAALAMTQGQFDIEVATGPEDEIGQLGKALVELGQVMKSQVTQLQTLSNITAQINAGLLLDDVLDQVFESLRPLVPYDRIGFSLLEQDGKIVRARWSRSDAAEMKITNSYAAPLEGSSLQRIIETGQPRILNDLEAYLRAHPQSKSTQLIVAEGMRSSLTCPLIAMGKPIGFMFFSSMRPSTYKDAHVELFLQIAGQLAVIVEKGRLYQRLVELDEVKNRFLGIAAHDLRSPISVVKSYAILFLKGYVGPITDQQREILQKMDTVSEKMLALINDLLDVSAIEAGQLKLEMRQVDLATYLQECYAENILLAQAKSIELALELEPNLPQASLDPQRISQVINNLITNAIKFSYSNTTITLRAGAVDGQIRISVRDQGQGIPAEEMGKMFTDFGRTTVRPTAGEKSTGLGLAIVKRIVEAHGGRVWVDSQVGVGSTFTFSLPLSPPV